MLWFMILPLWCCAAVPAIHDVDVVEASDAIQPNLVPNFSFEEVEDGSPVGWQWDQRNTDAVLQIDSERAHMGGKSLKLTNSTPYGAHVYGTLWTVPAVSVRPRTHYTLSFYAFSDAPGASWVGGGKGWRVRIGIQPTEGQWCRFSAEFTTAEEETEFVLRINTDSPTPGVWIDDVKLEEGTRASFCLPPGTHTGLMLAAQDWPSAMADGDWQGTFAAHTPVKQALELQSTLTQGDASTTHRMQLALEPGLSYIRVRGRADEPSDVPCTLAVRLADADSPDILLAESSVHLRFLSVTNARKRLANLRTASEKLEELVEEAKQAGQDTAYPQVGATVVRNFIPYIETDLERGELARAFDQLGELEEMAQQTRDRLRAALEDGPGLPEAPRYVTSPIKVEGPSFLAQAAFPASGHQDQRPIFFTGHGHFAQVRKDLEPFPDYGVNIIQIEFGPRSIFPEEGVTSDAVIKAYLKDFDRAADAGVAVCLLISPHYMPDWMVEKYPQLRIEREGFLKYCPHAPEGQDFLKRFLRVAIPLIKDHPALHSICLTNEPINAESPDCVYAQALWNEWLEQRHGEIGTLNRRWASEYASFEDVPLPEPHVAPTPSAYEFVLFNQEWFAGWHRMLADTIHEISPDLPVHAKAMSWNFFSDQDQRFGVNAELFGQFSQINGNDSANWYAHGLGEWAQLWQLNNAGHDLQRSVADLPVFNSENHLIRDRETQHIPSGHVRTTLWQAAIHGQSATTIWVWERTYDARSDFAGSIMHRPACAEAVGHTGLDLLRLSREVTAIQVLPAQVGLLYSTTAMVYDGGAYTDCLNRLYTALSFTGLKLGFVTERQLASGNGHRPPVLLIPDIHHLSDTAFEVLKQYPGRVVLVGDGSLLEWDAYRRERTASLDAEQISFSRHETEARPLWEQLLGRFPAWSLQPPVEITDEHGTPVWGVEWLVADAQGQTVVNLIQHARQGVRVRIARRGTPVAAKDLFTEEMIEGIFTLRPLEPRMLRLMDVGD